MAILAHTGLARGVILTDTAFDSYLVFAVTGVRNRGDAARSIHARESGRHAAVMGTKDLLGPFQAGDGGLPPYLAGRESEQDICRAFVSRLRHGRSPPREIVFYGPRGNGKTALLVWLQKEAASSPGVDVIRLVPAAIRTETKLVDRLLPSSWWQRLTPNENLGLRDQVAPGQGPSSAVGRGAHCAGEEGAVGAVARRGPHPG